MTGSLESRLSRIEAKQAKPPALRADAPVDVVDFAVRMLRVRLYPGQATLLRAMTCSLDTLTDNDVDQLARWRNGYQPSEGRDGPVWRGGAGIPGGDVAPRMQALVEAGAPWFSNVVMLVGRRGGKGHLAKIMVAWSLWLVLQLDDPHAFFNGMDPAKPIQWVAYSTSVDTVQRDIFVDVGSALDAACFDPWRGEWACQPGLAPPCSPDLAPPGMFG